MSAHIPVSDEDPSDEDLPDEDLSDEDLSDEDLSDEDLSDDNPSDNEYNLLDNLGIRAPYLKNVNGIKSYMCNLLINLIWNAPTNNSLQCIGIEAAKCGLYGVVAYIDNTYVSDIDNEIKVICDVNHPKFGYIAVGVTWVTRELF
jgi:hypothetical protein